MKIDIPVPFEKLTWFQEKLGFGAEDLRRIGACRSVFLERTEEFADSFYRFFHDIPETRLILDHDGRSLHLKKLWGQWYRLLFEDPLSRKALTYLWKSGLRHVEVNVDKRYINLGYAFVRQFFHRIASTVPNEDGGGALLLALDKLVDFCVLIETQAYIAASSQCDMEVVKGISHQVRNPLTVIGGNVLRLQKNVDPGSPLFKTYETILLESKRLEAMVRDTTVYSELYQKEPLLVEFSLEVIIQEALKRLATMEKMKTARVETALDPEVPLVRGDRVDMETLFYYLLLNSLEAADPADPLIRISSKRADSDEAIVEVEIFNTGHSPSPEDMENVFVPFFSLKQYGTGLGLPIALLAARKNLGDLYLEPVAGKGVRCVIRLPTPPSATTDVTRIQGTGVKGQKKCSVFGVQGRRGNRVQEGDEGYTRPRG
jgi:signal transduction histidine kinase